MRIRALRRSRLAALAALLLLAPVVRGAGPQAEPPDGELLEYLGSTDDIDPELQQYLAKRDDAGLQLAAAPHSGSGGT